MAPSVLRQRIPVISFHTSLLALVVVGCGPAALPAPDVICRIDGTEIKFGAFQSYIAQNSSESDRGLGSDVLSGILDQDMKQPDPLGSLELLTSLVIVLCNRGLIQARRMESL